ncbi:hybrid sensor histidine kinase/response regulator transcription factor [Flavilitoribacter nigricans]|nr:hybrid sensor histidine kinase/response regulator transcription factor [Flavilitoribacter nigricans]
MLWLLLLAWGCLDAQSDLFNFHRLTPRQGLTSGNWNYYVYKDSRGFVWVSSINGLNRFDGTSVRQYLPNEADSCSLSHNNIQGRIFEDLDGNIWFCTVDAIHQYIRKDDCFKKHHIYSPSGEKIEIGYLLLYLDPYQMELWLTAKNDLYFWKMGIGDQPVKVPDIPLSINTEIIQQDQTTSRYTFLSPAGDSGLAMLNFQNGKLIDQPQNEKVYFPQEKINAIYAENEREIWLGTNRGIAYFNLETLERRDYPLSSPGEEKEVVDIAQPAPHKLMVATRKHGIYFFYKGLEKPSYSQAIKSANEDGVLDFHPEITKLYADNSDNVWISTDHNGIYFTNLVARKFDFWLQNDRQSPSGKSIVKSMTEDIFGRIWALTNEGIVVMDNGGQEIHFFSSTDHPGLKAEPHQIRADAQNNIWVTNRNGLFRIINRPTPASLRGAGLQDYLHIENPYAIEFLPDGELLVTTLHAGIYQVDPQTPADSVKLSAKIGESIFSFRDNQGRIYINNMDQDLSIFTYENEKLDSLTARPFKHLITGMVEDHKRDCLWISSHDGLYYIQPSDPTFELRRADFEVKNLSGILQDKDGELWISSKDGLYNFNPESGKSVKFTLYHGLQGLEFIDWSALAAQKGRLFFGGTNGINVFSPTQVWVNDQPPSPLITEILVNGQELSPDQKRGNANAQNVTEMDQLTLGPGVDRLSFRFASPDYVDPESNEFWIKLVGLDQDSVRVMANSSIRFTNLSADDYQLIVYPTNSDGRIDLLKKKVLDIRIKEHWYNTTGAYILYILTLVGVFLAVRYVLNKVRSDNKMRKEAQKENKRLLELDDFKTRFYTNVSHEFRTPLTTILGMADEIKSDPEKWYSDGIRMIKRNGQKLLYLVNQILDISKLESGEMPLNMVQSDIVLFFRYILEPFQVLAAKKKITLHFLCDENSINMDYDPDKIMKILDNLLKNAIKFTPENGQIYFQVNRSGDQLELSVRDTGIGISKDHTDKVFKRFFIVDHADAGQEKGTGIGLAIVHELVTMLGGTVSVKSILHRGTTFRVLLPISNEAPWQTKKNEELGLSPNENWEPAPGIITKDQLLDREDAPIALVVEDDHDIASYIIACIDDRYQIRFASDGETAFNIAYNQIPDIIISDVMMQKMDGFELCERLKNNELTSHIPVILLTAKADMASKLSGLHKGADEYLTKPFEKSELLIRINNLIRLRKLMQEKYANGRITEEEAGKHEAAMAPPPEEDEFIKTLRDVELEHLSDANFGIEQLCHKIGVSRSQLYRKIDQLTGQPLGEFRRQIKFNEANHLLLNTEETIAEIAHKVGFSRTSSFSYAYKQHFGYSPSEARKNAITN